MTLIAGVDTSTQSCKVVILDAESGELVREGRATHPIGTEVDPKFWFKALQDAVSAAGGFDDVAAVSIGGQQHGMVVLNAAGEVIRPALLWNDTRSAGQAEELIAQFGADFLAEHTGSLPVASFTSTKLLWLKQNEPANAEQVAAVALPHDWLSWRLAGYGPVGDSEHGPDLSALTTDASDASGTGYFNPATNEYLSEVLQYCLGKVPILPRVVAANEVAHTTASGMLIGAGAGDNAAAGAGVLAKPGDVVVSLGTSGTVFSVSNTATNDRSGTIAGFASATGEFLPLVCTLNAARVIDSIAGLLKVDFDELGELALLAEPGADGVVLIPYFEGERTPNLPDAKASINGLSLKNNTRSNLARAAIEGMLCGLADGLAALLDAGVEAKRIILVGGAASNKAVQEIAAEVFGLDILIPKPGEYVAFGAAAQGASLILQTPPTWKLDGLVTVPAKDSSIALAQYRAVLAKTDFS